MDIRVDDLRSPEIIQLLRAHLQEMTLYSPPESIHALDVETLRRPDITFWSVAKHRLAELWRIAPAAFILTFTSGRRLLHSPPDAPTSRNR